MKYRLRRVAFIVGFGGAVLALLVAGIMDFALGREVLMISPHDPTLVELNRRLFVPGEPVATLYGNPLSDEVRVVLPGADRLVRPDEDPALLLMQVDKMKGENPLQTRTVWFITRFAVTGLVLGGLAGFVLPRRRAA
jgi:hypothetical protein